MGLQEVKDEILNDAERKSQEIEEEGTERAEEIIEEAEEEANQIVEEAKKEAEEEKEKLRKKRISKANMEAKKKVQASKEKNVGKIFDKFEERLGDLSESDKKQFLENNIQGCNFEVGLVKGSEEFEGLVDTDFEQIDSKGVVLESSSGEKSLNLTFERIRDEYEKNYRSDVARKLFEEV